MTVEQKNALKLMLVAANHTIAALAELQRAWVEWDHATMDTTESDLGAVPGLVEYPFSKDLGDQLNKVVIYRDSLQKAVLS